MVIHAIQSASNRGHKMTSTTIEEMHTPSPMQEFYRNKVVFLTGATGVLGELFVEKLLRCNVSRLYILLRPKKQRTPAERIRDVFGTALFERLRHQDPDYMDRIHAVDGDMAALGLGLSAADRALLAATVQIVIHAAANVRFDCPLHTILLTNVRGTRELLRLVAADFRLLLAFAYVSTAFVQSHRLNAHTAERFMPAPGDPDAMIRLAERLAEQQPDDALWVSVLTGKFIAPWPNTYSFSKAIAEELVRRWLPTLPIVVLRPSIVLSTFADPIPGYCANYFGMNGVIIGSAAGVMRVAIGQSDNVAHVVCADFVTNGTLAVIWDRAVNKKILDAPIFTMNSGHKELTWGTTSEWALEVYSANPWTKSLWKPSLQFVSNPWMSLYYSVVYQLIPGAVFDTVLRLSGNSLRVLPLYRRIYTMMLHIKFFMSTQWHFDVANMADMHSRMTPSDRQRFPIGAEKFDYPAFSPVYLLGLRRYVMRDPPDTVPAARQRFQWIRRLHGVSLAVYYALIAIGCGWLLRRMGVLDGIVDYFAF